MLKPDSPRVVPGCWGLPITLREFVPQDQETLFALLDRNRETIGTLGNTRRLNPLELRRLVDFMTMDSHATKLRFGIWHEGWVGTITLNYPLSEEPDITYWVGAEFRSKGYATSAVISLVRYAFDTLKAKRIVAAVAQDNEASQKVLGRAGFHVESSGDGWYTCVIQKANKTPAK